MMHKTKWIYCLFTFEGSSMAQTPQKQSKTSLRKEKIRERKQIQKNEEEQVKPSLYLGFQWLNTTKQSKTRNIKKRERNPSQKMKGKERKTRKTSYMSSRVPRLNPWLNLESLLQALDFSLFDLDNGFQRPLEVVPR